MFYTATANQKWEPTKAKTLAAAKRVVQSRNIFQGVRVYVGIKRDGNSFDRVAVRHQNGEWQQLTDIQ